MSDEILKHCRNGQTVEINGKRGIVMANADKVKVKFADGSFGFFTEDQVKLIEDDGTTLKSRSMIRCEDCNQEFDSLETARAHGEKTGHTWSHDVKSAEKAADKCPTCGGRMMTSHGRDMITGKPEYSDIWCPNCDKSAVKDMPASQVMMNSTAAGEDPLAQPKKDTGASMGEEQTVLGKSVNRDRFAKA